MYFTAQGIHTKQAHKGIPEGRVEEEQGRKGFFGPVSHLIRKQASTRWKTIDGPLKPRMFDLVKADASGKRQRLLFNKDISIYNQWIKPNEAKQLTAFRNADGDSIYFAHIGTGKLLTEYGIFDYRPGDYIVIPKCFGHIFLPDANSQFLLIESKTGSFNEPDRGMVGKNAVYDTAQLVLPNLEELHAYLKKNNLSCIEVDVKHTDQITRFEYEECIFDILGWKGDLFPFKLNMDQLMPLMSHRSHLPPSAHTTFVAPNFVVCSFVPRPIEFDDDALKVPFYHQNIDYDEVLFYHNGDFFSRSNLHSGMMSFHPAGFPHGPHPKAFEKIKGMEFTNEYAVMIDSRYPLERDPSMDTLEVQNYWQSWKS
ncbi:MAG: homogentisate 1,2-dioxygenase [Oligoflexia bacterium]|nr:homogentisate 1,2-dioxygenase [Oligoflexia bacterium]